MISLKRVKKLMLAYVHVEWQIHELAIKLSMQKSQNAELRSQFEGKSYVDIKL